MHAGKLHETIFNNTEQNSDTPTTANMRNNNEKNYVRKKTHYVKDFFTCFYLSHL